MQFIRDFNPKNRQILILTSILIILAVIVLPQVAQAFSLAWDFQSVMINVIGVFIRLITKVLTWVLGLFLDILVSVASFNHFIDNQAPTAVDIGWRLIRDLSNMMFIVIILIMAFGTIFKLQTYHAKSMLGKFIIMVFLVNFSKTICGFFIDFAQIAMMTFVNAFKDSAALDIALGMQMDKFTSLHEEGNVSNADMMSVMAAMLLSVVMLVVALGIIMAMTIILLFRVIIIWILVIFSPIAYIGQLLPQTKKYASQWWQEFGKYLIVGPVMAFFIWLALSIVVQMARTPMKVKEGGGISNPQDVTKPADTGGPSFEAFGATEITTTQAMFNYVVTIALLWAGLTMTQKMGVIGGSIAGKVQSSLQSWGSKALKKGINGIPSGYSWFARKMKAGKIGGKFDKEGNMLKAGWGYGVEINPVNIWRKRKAEAKEKRDKEEKLGDRLASMRLEEGGLKGFLLGQGSDGVTDNYFQGLFWHKGIRKLFGKGSKKNIQEKKEVMESAEAAVVEAEDSVAEENRPEIGRQILQQELDDKEGKLGSAQSELDELKRPDLTSRMEEVLARLSRLDRMDISKAPEIRKLEADLKQIENEQKEFDTPENKARISELERIIAPLGGDKGEVAQAQQKLNDYNNQKSLAEQDGETKDLLDKRIKRREETIKHIQNGGFSEAQRQAKEQELAGVKVHMDDLNLNIKEAQELGAKPEEVNKIKEMLTEAEAKRQKIQSDLDNDKDHKEVLTVNERDMDEVNRLNKEIGQDKHDRDKEIITEAERERRREDHEIKKKAASVAKKAYLEEAAEAPRDLRGRVALYKAMSERQGLFNTTNEHELMSLYQQAKARGDIVDMMTLMAQSTKAFHINEILNSNRARQNYYYDEGSDRLLNQSEWEQNGRRGKLYLKEGESLPSGAMGLHIIIREDFMPKLGKQLAFEFESDVTQMAQGVNHWTCAQTMAGDPAGNFIQRGLREWNDSVATERAKYDFEKLERECNRLGVGEERWLEDDDHSKGRYMILHDYAIKEMLENWPRIMEIVDRNRQNQSKYDHINRSQAYILDLMREQVDRTGGPADRVFFREKFLPKIRTVGKGTGAAISQRELRRIADILAVKAEESRRRLVQKPKTRRE